MSEIKGMGPGRSDEWYTPKYIFDALNETFDLDVASPKMKTVVPAQEFITELSLMRNWHGFVWMNPPFGGPDGIDKWANKFFLHGNGIALTPDRTCSKWWHSCAQAADAICFIKGRVCFVRPNGDASGRPAHGTTLFASGARAVQALERSKLGTVVHRK